MPRRIRRRNIMPPRELMELGKRVPGPSRITKEATCTARWDVEKAPPVFGKAGNRLLPNRLKRSNL